MKIIKSFKRKIYDLKWIIIRKWYKFYIPIRNLIFPQQKWLRRAIPRHFCDMDYIFEETLFEGLIFFWEEDNGEQNLRFQWENTEFDVSEDRRVHYKEIYDRLKNAYEFAKSRKLAYEYIHKFHKKYEDRKFYKDKLEALTTKHLHTIIELRDKMWT